MVSSEETAPTDNQTAFILEGLPSRGYSIAGYISTSVSDLVHRPRYST